MNHGSRSLTMLVGMPHNLTTCRKNSCVVVSAEHDLGVVHYKLGLFILLHKFFLLKIAVSIYFIFVVYFCIKKAVNIVTPRVVEDWN